jgi:hypothetical protein
MKFDVFVGPAREDNRKKNLSEEYIHFNRVKSSQVKLQGFECRTGGTYAKKAKQATNKDNAAACLSFLNYLVFLRPAADSADSELRWVEIRGRSYGLANSQ